MSSTSVFLIILVSVCIAFYTGYIVGERVSANNSLSRLTTDKDYWGVWRANLAIVIFKNYHKYYCLITEKNSPNVRRFCDICAEDFLKILTKKDVNGE